MAHFDHSALAMRVVNYHLSSSPGQRWRNNICIAWRVKGEWRVCPELLSFFAGSCLGVSKDDDW